MLRIAFWLTPKLADVVVADSREVQRNLNLDSRDHVMFVPYGIPEVPEMQPNAVEVLTELGVEPKEYLLFVGRFAPEKDILTLVRAHRSMSQPRPQLVLVGGKPDDSAYAREVADEAADDVVFAGPLFGTALDPVLRFAKAYVQPSVMEGTSPMLLTAMAYGLNVIASDIPENQETMGPQGRFFVTQDVASLQTEFEALGKEPAEEERRASELRQHVSDTYSWDSVTDDYLVAYQRALQR